MDKTYVIGLDQSTQGTKAILLDKRGDIWSEAYLPHRQIISSLGWVSHDGEEIFRNCMSVIIQLLKNSGIDEGNIAAIGISNQRETTLAWNRDTGVPVEPAVVWQCARASQITSAMNDESFKQTVKEKTGLPLSPYFPAAKAAWIMKNNPTARQLAQADKLCLGTVDSWLVYKLTEGKTFKTDYSNASRTQLFNLHTLAWDEDICKAFGIPMSALPTVEDSNGNYGTTTLGGLFKKAIPICGVLGDSHGALFGQGCIRPGMAKATYGTGSSIMMNIGDNYKESKSGLATSLAWSISGKVNYVFEGNINYSGAVISWLKNDVGIIENAAETSQLAFAANQDDGCYLVPAFSGLGAPHWQEDARGILCGMSRTTGKKEIVKAALESIAYQVTDVVKAMEQDAQTRLTELRVDGGPISNEYLMQFQSDMVCADIAVPKAEQLSAIGVAILAGVQAEVLDFSILQTNRQKLRYTPKMGKILRDKKYNGWKMAVEKTM